MGIVPSTFVGFCDAVPENEAGASLRIFAKEFSFRVANSYSQRGHNWVNSRGMGTPRIYYVLVSDDVPSVGHGSQVLRNIDLSTSEHDDHFVVASPVAIPRSSTKSSEPKRVGRKDRSCKNDIDQVKAHEVYSRIL